MICKWSDEVEDWVPADAEDLAEWNRMVHDSDAKVLAMCTLGATHPAVYNSHGTVDRWRGKDHAAWLETQSAASS